MHVINSYEELEVGQVYPQGDVCGVLTDSMGRSHRGQRFRVMALASAEEYVHFCAEHAGAPLFWPLAPFFYHIAMD